MAPVIIPGRISGSSTFKNAPHGSAAEVESGLGKGSVHLAELWKHLQNDIGRAEGDVGGKHGEEIQACGKAEKPTHKNKHQHE